MISYNRWEAKGVLFVLLIFGWIGSPAQSNMDRALKAYYSFDDCDAQDDSGNNSHGTLENVECQCGASGESLFFRGNESYIELDGNVNEYFKATNFTVSFYFRPATSSPNTVLMSKLGCDDDVGWIMRYGGNGSIAVQLIGNNDVENRLNVQLQDPTCWTHLALVRKGSAIELYENGKLIAEQDNEMRNTNIENKSKLRIGAAHCESALDRPFRGNIDELRIYNEPLDALQIRRLILPVDQILTQDTVVARGDSFIPSMSSTCSADVEWSPSHAVSDTEILKPVITVNETTTLEVKYNYGSCVATDQLQVRVVDSDEIDCESIPMARAFTPNGDGLNDTYGITIPGAFDRLISFEIFNQWGERIFQTDQVDDSWDGTFKGQKMNPGGFLYKIRYECRNQEFVKTGEFLLLN